MSVPEARAKAIRDFKRPVPWKGLRSFFCVVGFYRRYLHMLAKKTALLSPATSKLALTLVSWSNEMVSAFQIFVIPLHTQVNYSSQR